MEIPNDQQNKTTWERLRELFTNSTNKFILLEKIAVEECKLVYARDFLLLLSNCDLDKKLYFFFAKRTENVTFKEITHCSSNWPNHENCIKIELAIHLNKLKANNSSEVKRYQSIEELNDESITTTATTVATATTPPESLNAEVIEYELTAKHLQQMWIAYGKPEFAHNNIKVLHLILTLLFYCLIKLKCRISRNI